MYRVVKVTPLPNYHLSMFFSDGVEKTVDVRPFLRSGVSAPLLDNDYFQQVAIDSAGGIYWPNGYDFCPNFLYEEVPAVELAL